jgi:hypothetical protein
MKYGDWKAKSDTDALNESLKGKTVVFTFGRFQPPTSGHQKLVDAIVSTASSVGGQAMLYPARSIDAKKNPLNPGVKIKWLRKFFGDKVNIMDDSGAKTMFDVMNKFQREGVKKVIMVVGGDRVNEMRNTIKPYLTHKDPNKRYSFEFEVVSAGERDPDAEGVVGMSASKMRAAAAENNMSAFMGGIPSGVSKSDAESLFKELRRAMNAKSVVESVDIDSLIEIGQLVRIDSNVRFWLDEVNEIYYAVETDSEGNSTEGGYGTLETMLSMYPGSWSVLKGQIRNIVSRRAKARRVDGDEDGSLKSPPEPPYPPSVGESTLLKPWMLQLQSLREVIAIGVMPSIEYIASVPCSKRKLPMRLLRSTRYVDPMVKNLQFGKKEAEEAIADNHMLKFNKAYLEFANLFITAADTGKESDWKAAQQNLCKNYSIIQSGLPTEISALLLSGPAP